MSALADGIDLPIVGALGLAVFGPLTLVVIVVEAGVFKGALIHPDMRIEVEGSAVCQGE